MPTTELINNVADGQRYHGSEVDNDRIALLGCGIAVNETSLLASITDADLNITFPSFLAVVPDGSGSFVFVDYTGAAVAVTTNSGDVRPRHDQAVLAADGTLTVTPGQATAEVGDVKEAPMPDLATDEILVCKIRMPGSASVVTSTNVFGRLKRVDIYRERTLQAWVADDAQNPSLGNLPAITVPQIPEKVVTEAFDGSGTDEVSVGTDADNDAYSELTDVTTTGAKNPASGVDALEYNTAAKAVEAYYVNGGGEPTTGKVLVTMRWHFVLPEVA